MGADAVERFIPGTGQNAGQGPEYFPHNVLGLPDTAARPSVPSVMPEHILSLGIGGEIVLRFDRTVITDGPGPDFTVFENAFYYTIGERERIYAEPGEVSVSCDGVNFVAFPFDTLTLEGCAGMTPTRGDRDPSDPTVSGGDSFDLAELGIDSVRWVRIRDVTWIPKNNRDHPFWEATLSGFDLDAVVVARHDSIRSHVGYATHIGASFQVTGPDPFVENTTVQLSLERRAHVRVRLVDAIGRERSQLLDDYLNAGMRLLSIRADDLPSGCYFLMVEIDGEVLQPTALHLMR
jgi:hypothetical protein